MEISEYNYCLCGKNPIRILPAEKSGKCPRCRDKKLSGLYSALSYKERALTKKLIRQFKYEPRIKSLAKDLVKILMEHFEATGSGMAAARKNDALVAVPLEKSRFKNRGYNQSEELGKELSKILLIPLISNNLIKIKKTFSQIELSAEERKKNLKNAFIVKNYSEIRGKKIILVDDVYTTGSTMEECATVLKNAGAKQVWGITVARES